MLHAFNASICEEEEGMFLWVQSQSALHREVQARQGYTLRPCLKQPMKEKQNSHRCKSFIPKVSILVCMSSLLHVCPILIPLSPNPAQIGFLCSSLTVLELTL